MKIDLVYTWVNGADLSHHEKVMEIAKKFNVPENENTYHESRFIDTDFLKYSLRSVEKNMLWINKIFVIVDSQIPEWLKLGREIQIIEHKDLLGKYYPNFNSIAIETFLYKIPGLSEFFIYSNDDFFCNREISRDYFFDVKEKPIYRGGFFGRKHSNLNLHCRVTYQAIIYAYVLYSRWLPIRFSHNMTPFRKSFLKDNIEESTFQDWIELLGKLSLEKIQMSHWLCLN
ncbi:MAG: Stealth CR1 domain-containing protein [Endomicrobium sp.]|nr:Stealth CR1 domain-containing protein [Endomicrobium sp.]